MMRHSIFILFFICISCVYANTTDVYPFANVNDAKRFDTLTKEIRCVVCQGQNIADSNAPLAQDLRGKVYKMVQEKKSDNDIKNYLVKRYGDFILLKPRVNKLTLFLWIFPLISLLAILVFSLRMIKIRAY